MIILSGKEQKLGPETSTTQGISTFRRRINMAATETIFGVAQLVNSVIGDSAVDECCCKSIGVIIFLVGAAIDIGCLVFDGLFWRDIKGMLKAGELLPNPRLEGAIDLLLDSIIGTSTLLFVEIVVGIVMASVQMSETRQLIVSGLAWALDVLQFIFEDFIATVAFLQIVDEGSKQGVDIMESQDGSFLALSMIVSAVWMLPKTIVNFFRIIFASMNRGSDKICYTGTCLAVLQNVATYAYLIVTISHLSKTKDDSRVLETMHNVYQLYFQFLSVMFGINVAFGLCCICFCNNVLKIEAWRDEIKWGKEHMYLFDKFLEFILKVCQTTYCVLCCFSDPCK